MNFEIFIDKIILVFYIGLTLGLVIFFHELGHFVAAKIMGVKVEKFSLGFGKELFGFDWKGTRMIMSVFPIGGYVKMRGENVDEPLKGEPDEYLSQKWYKRAVIVGAGPIMNFVLAVLIFTIIIAFVGLPIPSKEPVIGGIMSESPAEEAGLKIGDRIIEIDGRGITLWRELVDTIHPRNGTELEILIERDERRFTRRITPKYNEQTRTGLIGIIPKTTDRKVNIFSAFWYSIQYVFGLVVLIIRSLFLMIVGKMKADVAGPVGIFQMVGKVAKAGFVNVFHFIGLISVNLAIINLFPIPILDGGHLVFLLFEGIKGKPLDTKKVKIAQIIGLAVIIILLIFATSQDLMRIIRKP